MAVSDKHKHLFVANKVNATLDVIDIEEGKLLQQIPGQKGCSGIDYAPDLDCVMIASGAIKQCNIYKYNGKTYEFVKTIEIEGGNKVRYKKSNQQLYVANKADGKHILSVYDKDFNHVTDINLPGGHSSYEIAQKSPRIFMNGPGSIYVVDTDNNKALETLPLTLSSINKPIVIDEQANRVFVGCRKPPKVVIFNSKTGKEITSAGIANDLDDFSFDIKRKRIYAACGEGFISVIQQIDPDNYKLIENVQTRKRARTGIFSQGMDLYFLGVQITDDMENPEIWVYKPL
jgi:DNA-binding beta-propeller fold protein YncE